eukprot:2910057-Prymnesium_polylepis.1
MSRSPEARVAPEASGIGESIAPEVEAHGLVLSTVSSRQADRDAKDPKQGGAGTCNVNPRGVNFNPFRE